jgi:hypothetical protein
VRLCHLKSSGRDDADLLLKQTLNNMHTQYI